MTLSIADPLDAFAVVLPPDPYPGLRPFEKDEWPIFFGREPMIDEVIGRLIRQRLVVVHGDSGSGKSSLIKAGVLARLEQESARGGIEWRTCEMQPREAVLQTLAGSVARLESSAPDPARVVEIRRVLNFGREAPQALTSLVRRGDSDQVCILVDQFEELFALARREGPDEANLFAQFLVGVLDNPQPGLYVVVTMRSEFLGVCSQFAGLAEAVNRAQYLLPRMAHTDLLRAIRQPATAYGGQVSRDLAERLMADAGGTQDELPLIQHGLLMLYRRRVPSDGVTPSSWRLDVTDYEGSGSLRGLLSNHVDEVAERADPAGGEVVERLFRALTEINAEGQAIRRPQTFGRLLQITGATDESLRRVIDTFRAEGASFLRPYGNEPIDETTVIDISHEALIRSWQRIADPRDGWLVREFQDGLIWKSLIVQAESYERDASSVLSAATSKEREVWLRSRNRAWAERYGGGWERVTRLIEGSVEAARREREAEEKAARRQTLFGWAFALVLLTFLVFAVYEYRKVRDALDQSNTASAASLWNRLDFSTVATTDDELSALWEIAAGQKDVSTAFVRELTGESHQRPLQFARRPGPIARAVGLRWAPDIADNAFQRVAALLTQETDTSQLQRLQTAARTLAPMLSKPGSVAAAQRVESSLVLNGNPKQMTALANVLGALASQLSVDESLAASTKAASMLPPNLGVSAQVVTSLMTALGGQFTSEQALSVIATARTSAGSRSPGRANSVVVALASRLNPRDAAVVLGLLLSTAATAPVEDVEVFMEPYNAALDAVIARLSPVDARRAFTDVVGRLPGAEGSAQAPILLHAALKLLPTADDAQVHATFRDLFADAVSVNGHVDFELLAPVVPRLSREQIRPVARWLADSTVSSELAGTAALLIAVKDSLRESEVVDVFDHVGSAIVEAQSSEDAERLLRIARDLSPRLSPVAALSLLRLVLVQIAEIQGEPLTPLSSFGQIVAARLAPAEARVIATSTLSLFPRLQKPGQLEAVSAIVHGFSQANPQVIPDTIDGLVNVLRTGRDIDRVASAATALRLLSDQVNEQQAAAALQLLIKRINGVWDTKAVAAIGAAVPDIGRRVNANQASVLFPDIFTNVLPDRTEHSDADEVTALVHAAAGLAHRLPPERAREAAERLSTFLPRDLSDAAAPDDGLALAFTLWNPLANEATPEVAQRALQTVIIGAIWSSRIVDAGELAAAGRALAQRVRADQAKLLLQQQTILLPTGATGARRGVNSAVSRALGSIAVTLTTRLEPVDAELHAGRVLRMIGVTTSDDDPQSVRPIAGKLLDKISHEAAQRVLRSAVGWAGSQAEANLWSKLLIERLGPSTDNEADVRVIVELLKFPMTAGTPTDTLLDALRTRDASAPGAAAGLVANLDWIAQKYPRIDLTSPPICPAPPISALTCPASVH